ncbi:MAG TPA: amidohydrolase family protein [Candidatus Nanoarchaeia archaeon]|nr:amidohydrolase family protein [Candidatus Nanoarchaeia archaeon]
MRILDFHAHIGIHKDGMTKRSLSKHMADLKKYAVSYSVIFPFDTLSVEKSSFQLLEEARHHQNLFVFFRFNPNTIKKEELEQALEPFRGVKLHPRAQNFDPLDERFSWIFDRLAKWGKPVLIHSRCERLERTDPVRLVDLARRFPILKVVLGHFGGALTDVFKQVKALDNLFLETSVMSSPHLIEEAVRVCGADKILFGSDVPFSDLEIEVLKVLKTHLSDAEKQKILFKNAARLLGLPQQSF